MSKLIDLTGQTFNRLFIISRAENSRSGRAMWKCQCSCGNTTTARGESLTSGNTKSCGCLVTKHGMTKTSEFKVWQAIIDRCCNPNCTAFKNYGGRGITICDEWKNDFMAFFNHVGKLPSHKHSIDRIDNDGNYEPGNVQWTKSKNQANNRRNNRHITLHGWTLTTAQWADFIGIDSRTIWERLGYGWHPAKAIFQPIKHNRY